MANLFPKLSVCPPIDKHRPKTPNTLLCLPKISYVSC